MLLPGPDTAARLRRLIELENACCAWIKWSITEGALMEVDTTADQPQGVELLGVVRAHAHGLVSAGEGTRRLRLISAHGSGVLPADLLALDPP